ncbi:MAG: DUF3596 domain-containing protein [Cyanobacteria bacterium]|nr:DUF3596 domain-containing protein [Cyanobacteriota bacterium]
MKVESFKGRFRLRWSFQGERFSLSLGLDDTQWGRTIAQGRVSQIETDIITGKFDRTLATYRTGCIQTVPAKSSLEMGFRFSV